MGKNRLVFLAAGLTLAAAGGVLGYGAEGHRQITRQALQILSGAGEAAYTRFLSTGGSCPEIQAMRKRPLSFRDLSPVEKLIDETPAVDGWRDVEFVDVEGGIGSGGRDNPHKFELNAINDKPMTGHGDMSFTAMNHFIDIRKGPGQFDDYDGYSYRRGSGHIDERQKAESAASSWFEGLAAKVSGLKVDEGVNWWLNDAYVHVSGQEWYRNCSPAMERYSFFQDSGKYKTRDEELAARFPLAKSTGERNHGVPYSVFMPVDNMARYWYGRFTGTGDILALAPVPHAVQDASVPHHAAGCLGNWHSQYESDVDAAIQRWTSEPGFAETVRSLVADWSIPDPSPPARLAAGDRGRRPSIDWRVDQLVTWLALNSFEEYHATYGDFKDGYRLSEPSAKKLAGLATAMSALVLKKACGGGSGGAYGIVINVPDLPAGDQPIAVSFRAGDSFTIRIAANHTTGYQWRLAGAPDAKVVTCTGSTYEAPPDSVPGKGGTEVWSFKATGKGSATIRLDYVRPWEVDAKPAATQPFNVTVN